MLCHAAVCGRTSGNPGERVGVRPDTSALPLIERIDRRDLLRGQLRRGVQVRMVTTGQRDVTTLERAGVPRR